MTEYEAIKKTWEVRKTSVKRNRFLFSWIFVYTNEVSKSDEIKWTTSRTLTEIRPKNPTIISYKGKPGGLDGI